MKMLGGGLRKLVVEPEKRWNGNSPLHPRDLVIPSPPRIRPRRRPLLLGASP